MPVQVFYKNKINDLSEKNHILFVKDRFEIDHAKQLLSKENFSLTKQFLSKIKFEVKNII